uniref:Bis(5'-nucleosyl)-tetraphosphatase [asymmetrical] n=1 Tax=Rhabditophanes sp. KR3021 TaxID=114890 RepID=A0AC35TQC8_9BILA
MSITKAAGILVYRRISEKIEYLLLQASYPPHHWTPPKGHVDPTDKDEFEAAMRETKEEANIGGEQLEVDQNYSHLMQYEVKGKPKTIKYWIGKLKDGSVVELSHEHQNQKWCELAEALKVTDYKEMQILLVEAEEYIRNNHK